MYSQRKLQINYLVPRLQFFLLFLFYFFDQIVWVQDKHRATCSCVLAAWCGLGGCCPGNILGAFPLVPWASSLEVVGQGEEGTWGCGPPPVAAAFSGPAVLVSSVLAACEGSASSSPPCLYPLEGLLAHHHCCPLVSACHMELVALPTYHCSPSHTEVQVVGAASWTACCSIGLQMML